MTYRRDKRIIPLCVGIFIMFFAITFLSNYHSKSVEAADLQKFDPGFIISDYMMSDYKSMNETEIQQFLTEKNKCENKDRAYYVELTSKNPGVEWHWKNNHFVCLSEELFGDGVVIGEGKTAAKIIYETAQEFKINPQVLLVLIQKESGLITDAIPNNIDYRSMTGFGCPDTAACDSKYYGFTNQLRSAAKLFREVLDGGWTNYPIGENYIKYNPDASCGGSTVAIKNLATSSLYRYTPYQPNAEALKAGYGKAPCGAYGNRNFYNYFYDWFGDPTFDGWNKMITPRYMENIKTKEIKFYSLKIDTDNGLCLGEKEKQKTCTPFTELKEVDWQKEDMITERYMVANDNAKIVYLTENNLNINFKEQKTYYYTKKIILPDSKMCLLPENQEGWCTVYDDLTEIEWRKEKMLYPRYMVVEEDTDILDPLTKEKTIITKKGEKYYFDNKYVLLNGEQCLIIKDQKGCIYEKNLNEDWREMEIVREMQTNRNLEKINSITGEREYQNKVESGIVRKFVEKIKQNEEWCLKTEYDYENKNNSCILQSELDEVWNNVDLEEYTVVADIFKVDAKNLNAGIIVEKGTTRKFTSKYYIFGLEEWCYRTEYDTVNNTNFCIPESNIKLTQELNLTN